MVQESLIEGIFRSLKKNAGWATIIVGIAVACSFLLNRFVPTIYQSESLLRVMTTENTNEISLAATMQGVLSQNSIIEEIAKKSRINEPQLRREDTIILSDAGPGLVKLEVRHENPVMLKELGNTVIQVLSEQFLGYSSEAQDFEVKALQKRLKHLEKNLSDLKIEQAKLSLTETTKIDEPMLTLENTINQLEEKIDINTRKLQTTPEETFYFQEEENPEYKNFNSELKNERNELVELFKNYKEKHPRVIACQNRIKKLEENLGNAKTRTKKKKSNPEYAALTAEIKSDREQLDDIRTKLNELKNIASLHEDSGENTAESISLRIATLEELHRKAILELEESKISQNTTAGRINVLKKDARPPQTVGFSSVQRGCLALASGVLLAVLLLYSPAPVRAEFVSVSGNIMAGGMQHANHLALTAEPAEIILEVPSMAREPLALPCPVEREFYSSHYDERLIALNDPDSATLKPFKNLVSNLQISMSESQTRIVLVGSARSGTGRTTLLANTAVLLAQAGYSVLMVDANFRNPMLHRVFDLNNNKGLANILAGEEMKDAIQRTSVAGLSLLSAGISPFSPSEALGSQEMIELLANLKRKTEILLIDTPALLEHPEAGILAGHAGAMVFLHREGEPEEDLRSARKLLNNVRAKVFGYVKI